MADGELKEHALNSSHDFYELLGISVAANDAEIRRAYRKTALKYHPDKVGADAVALDKFHLLQIAYDVLSDETVRQLYDNARRAREDKKLRESAYSDRRRQLKEDLEARERAGVAGLKRKREEANEEEAFQQELRRLAADGARRRKEREELLRREASEANWNLEREQKDISPSSELSGNTKPTDIDEVDRTIKLRYPVDTPNVDEVNLTELFERFGKIEHLLLRNKKIKLDGEKHRKEYTIAIIVYSSIVGAHKAMVEFPRLLKEDGITWSIFEDVNWQSGQEPECIPKARYGGSTSGMPKPKQKDSATESAPRTPASKLQTEHNLRQVPSFGSFKATPTGGTDRPRSNLGDEDAMMIRLKKAAERRRLEEDIKRQEALEEK